MNGAAMRQLSLAVASMLLAFVSRGAAEEGWHVAEQNGAPGLFLDGRPVAPVMFWQWEAEEQDMKALAGAGVKLFGIFGSFGHYLNPYWGQEGFCGMAYQDERLDRLLEWVPDAAFLPRVFAAAPQWWIDANPDEQTRIHRCCRPIGSRFASPSPVSRSPRRSVAANSAQFTVRPSAICIGATGSIFSAYILQTGRGARTSPGTDSRR